MTKSCETCKWSVLTGGDSVDYGSITARLPEYFECDCVNIPDEEFDKMEEVYNNNGLNCNYFENE